MTIYLSGPMTGKPNWNAAEFAKYAEIYRNQGFEVISPPELDEGHHDEPWSTYMRRDIGLLLNKVERIYLLPDWFDSKGAKLEVACAQAFDIPIYYAPSGDLMPNLSVRVEAACE